MDTEEREGVAVAELTDRQFVEHCDAQTELNFAEMSRLMEGAPRCGPRPCNCWKARALAEIDKALNAPEGAKR